MQDICQILSPWVINQRVLLEGIVGKSGGEDVCIAIDLERVVVARVFLSPRFGEKYIRKTKWGYF